jgi:hypothetical protein
MEGQSRRNWNTGLNEEREDMPGKSLNEGTDTWSGKQPLRRIKKRILSRRTTRKTGKRNTPGCSCRDIVNAKFFMPEKERAAVSHSRGNNLIIDVNISCKPEVKAAK